MGFLVGHHRVDPAELLRQNKQGRRYWHRRFRYLMLDEHQYSNRTPCTLIKLLLTDGSDSEMSDDGQNRSVGVEGDADQSIDSFRAADEVTLTMAKLEEKLLLSTCGEGKPITLTRCDDGIAEAEALMQNMRMLKAAHPDLS